MVVETTAEDDAGERRDLVTELMGKGVRVTLRVDLMWKRFLRFLRPRQGVSEKGLHGSTGLVVSGGMGGWVGGRTGVGMGG